MSNPWDIKSDDSRKEDSLPTFIIFCEDKVSEPIYFKYFETAKIKVIPIGPQKDKIANVFNAIKYCIDNGYMETRDGVSQLICENPMIWCVYDRDIEVSATKNQIDNISFNESIEIAKAKGFNVAWSNDAFELWVLLHFEDVDVNNDVYKHRQAYYNRLNEIFKALPDPNADLVKALNYKSFTYEVTFKHEDNFRNIVRPEIVSKTSDAIERAKRIEAHFADKDILNHQKAPCTMVHHLVEELIRLGGKEC